jgi:hypothetical protein
MPSRETVYTAAAVADHPARRLLAVAGVLRVDDALNADALSADLVERGWQVGIDQEQPLTPRRDEDGLSW